LLTSSYKKEAKSEIQRYFRRKHGSVAGLGKPVTDQEYSNHKPEIIKKFQSMLDNEGEVPTKFKTRKFAQRLLPKRWGDSGPNITVASLPDDFVHFSQPRILTVRGMEDCRLFPTGIYSQVKELLAVNGEQAIRIWLIGIANCQSILE
jgi:DNA (cytosine-5)-methyltransferase 1